MRGIILAGGTGSRLGELSRLTNKHLLPVGNKPMIYHPIEKLTAIGIDDIMIVTGTEHAGDIFSLLGSGSRFNCRFTYRVQDEAGGIAQALSLAEDFASGCGGVVVLLGDNIFEESLETYHKAFQKHNGKSCLLVLKQVEDPTRYGVVDIKDNKITNILEKPHNPPSDLCVTGIYFYPNSVFDYTSMCNRSDRGEYEITDVNMYYVRAGNIDYEVMSGWWTDAGTPESYRKANELVQ